MALTKRKSPHSRLLTAMAQSSRRPRILYTQGRSERMDHGARRAAEGGPARAEIPPQTQGVDNANGPPTDPGSSPGDAKSSR